MDVSERIRRFEAVFDEDVETDSPTLALSSLTGSAAAFSAIALAHRGPGRHPVLVVTPGLPEAETTADDLKTLEGESGVRALLFPPILEGDPTTTAARLKVAAVLDAFAGRPYPLVVVTPFTALLTRVPKAAAVTAATVRLEVGASLPDLAERLAKTGYERVGEVVGMGQFAIRGGVFDVWPPDADRPVRAEFFGDEIDSLRAFDAGTQVSVKPLAEAVLGPVTLPEETCTLLDLFPSGATVLWLEHNGYGAAMPPISSAAFQVYTGDPAPAGVPTGRFMTSPLPGFAEMGADAARNPEIIDTVRNRLTVFLVAAKGKGALVSEDDELSGGFSIRGLVVATKRDRVFAHRRAAPRTPVSTAVGARLGENFDLEPGELVVHAEYGIGRFAGSTEIEVGGKRSEVFTIEYADGKLHVPVTHAHLLSRYVGVKGQEVKLHRLDGRRWTKEKSETQKAVMDLAASLLDTQAKRATSPGFAYDLSLPGIEQFEAAFPFEETPDQLQAIRAVKQDLAATKPMDRLLCGDAGYGKTEVAMRAAFIVAMNGRQVAVLAPTTVLAEQHYESFLARFDGTPVRIEVMSRFQTPSAKEGTCARVLSGATDIVIGTHAILSQQLRFKDLGLVVIDEEQRFGVKQKEHLKRLRATADILTMSATPIPRTLYMSMTGTRDLSILRTPPRERVAVETTIARDTDQTIGAAIDRELARGGQVYYLYNRVVSIEKMRRRLAAIEPKARIEVAHGQMPGAELAEKMRRFATGKVDILLCTSIIESGLDITRANTIVVDRADRFGLAELYQIRGRVGRGARQGYAYFLLPTEGLVDAEARERLAALKKHAGLGAGFNIALRDLEIRGAGNLLGSEQSGHIAAVGFQLYCQLLQQTIARLKGEKVRELVDVSLTFDFLDLSPGTANPEDSACLPYDYVEDDAQRMDFHRRLAGTTTVKEVRALARELADRYGRLPPPAKRLVDLTEFRVQCAAEKVRRIDVRDGVVRIYRVNEPDPKICRVSARTTDAKLKAIRALIA